MFITAVLGNCEKLNMLNYKCKCCSYDVYLTKMGMRILTVVLTCIIAVSFIFVKFHSNKLELENLKYKKESQSFSTKYLRKLNALKDSISANNINSLTFHDYYQSEVKNYCEKMRNGQFTQFATFENVLSDKESQWIVDEAEEATSTNFDWFQVHIDEKDVGVLDINIDTVKHVDFYFENIVHTKIFPIVAKVFFFFFLKFKIFFLLTQSTIICNQYIFFQIIKATWFE
jgi:hypothetical protein